MTQVQKFVDAVLLRMYFVTASALTPHVLLDNGLIIPLVSANVQEVKSCVVVSATILAKKAKLETLATVLVLTIVNQTH